MARGLSVDLVVSAAIELADEHGLEYVTMARVAQRCGFTTMSLYRHVAGKDELVTRMLDRALGLAPEFEIPDWRSGLERWAREMLAVLMRHPWGIDVPITGMLGTEAQLSWLDRGLQTLASTSMSEADKAEALLLVNGYVFWGARLAFQVPEDADTRFVPPDVSRFPWLQRAVEGGVFEDDEPMDAQFDRGLQRVLDGIASAV
jgi:AcrR family transcriptional regulator